MTPKWHSLTVRGAFNPAVQEAAKDASGAYAVRRASDHEVLYVGESSRGALWKTLLRHFQAPASFKKVREGFVVASPDGYEVALHVTSRGARPRASSKRAVELGKRGAVRTDADQRASEAQARWIATLHPKHNKDDGMADAAAQELRATRARQEEEERDAGAFDSFLNPGRVPRDTRTLMWLGLLTRLELVKGRAIEWSLREAPILAYDPKRTKAGGACLVICYRGRIVRASTSAELREYRRKHWGASRDGVIPEGSVRDCTRAVGPFRPLGVSTSITYTTKKGLDAAIVDWVHPWGEGARRALQRPTVEEHACKGGCGPRCAAAGSIRLSGGTYSLEDRGIVG